MVSLAGSAQQSLPVEPLWPKVLLRTPGTSGPFADTKSQPARSKSLRIVILDHQPGGFRLYNLVACPEELAQKRGQVRRESVRTTSGSTQLPPVWTIPVPLLDLRIISQIGRGQVPRMKVCFTVCSASSMARSRSPLSKLVRLIAVIRQACGSQR
jgi:hypothetical protein